MAETAGRGIIPALWVATDQFGQSTVVYNSQQCCGLKWLFKSAITYCPANDQTDHLVPAKLGSSKSGPDAFKRIIVNIETVIFSIGCYIRRREFQLKPALRPFQFRCSAMVFPCNAMFFLKFFWQATHYKIDPQPIDRDCRYDYPSASLANTDCHVFDVSLGDALQGAAADCKSAEETHAWFDSRVAHHAAFASRILCDLQRKFVNQRIHLPRTANRLEMEADATVDSLAGRQNFSPPEFWPRIVYIRDRHTRHIKTRQFTIEAHRGVGSSKIPTETQGDPFSTRGDLTASAI